VHEAIYQEKLAHYESQNQGEKKEDTMWNALTSEDSRGATFICLAISVFNILSGQSVICMYSSSIFEFMQNKGAMSKYLIK
jgi:hypothetical protein